MDGSEASEVRQDRGPASGAAFQLPLRQRALNEKKADGGPERLMEKTWPRRKKTWRELDPYRDTHTHIYIYRYVCMYLRMLTHICSYNMYTYMCVLSIFVCECMCFYLIIPKWGQGL